MWYNKLTLSHKIIQRLGYVVQWEYKKQVFLNRFSYVITVFDGFNYFIRSLEFVNFQRLV